MSDELVVHLRHCAVNDLAEDQFCPGGRAVLNFADSLEAALALHGDGPLAFIDGEWVRLERVPDRETSRAIRVGDALSSGGLSEVIKPKSRPTWRIPAAAMKERNGRDS